MKPLLALLLLAGNVSPCIARDAVSDLVCAENNKWETYIKVLDELQRSKHGCWEEASFLRERLESLCKKFGPGLEECKPSWVIEEERNGNFVHEVHYLVDREYKEYLDYEWFQPMGFVK